MDLKTITDHYHERMQRILLFEPLYRLERKEVKTKEGQAIYGMGLGLLTLLFFFENMLFRKQAVGVKELAAFLQMMTQDILPLDMAGYEKIACDIVAVFRPSTGRRNEKTFFNWEMKQIEEMHLDVHALRERMNKIANEVHRNIISEETLERYNKMIGDINLRMEREEQEFRELKDFVKNTRDKIGDNIINDLDRKAYENILEVDKQLGIVQQSAFPEISEESLAQKALENLQRHYLNIMQLIFTAMGERREITLAEVIAELRYRPEAAMLESKQFYLLWIFLHRKSPFAFVAKEISDKSAFYQTVLAMPYVAFGCGCGIARNSNG